MAQRVNYKRDKRQRELKKQEKAQLKLQKRLARTQPPAGVPPSDEVAPGNDDAVTTGADDPETTPDED